MPQYEFFCHACKKLFAKALTLAEYEKAGIVCPQCGSDEQTRDQRHPSCRLRPA
jgi:putative FmdB family regulatory protein